jgi:hypothetical protein
MLRERRVLHALLQFEAADRFVEGLIDICCHAGIVRKRPGISTRRLARKAGALESGRGFLLARVDVCVM